jgi:signal transduction histidine kinase
MIIDFLPLAAGILSILLGVVVLVNGTDRQNMRLPFALFAGSVGIWAIFISFFRLSNDPVLARLFVDVYYIAALFIAYSFLIFSLYYSRIKISRPIVIIALLPWLALSVMIAVPYLFIGDILTNGPNEVRLIQPAYAVYAAFFVSYVLISLGALWRRAWQAGRRHLPFRVLAVSLTACLMGGAYFNLVLPWVGNYSTIALGPLFSFLMVASVFYVIARHGLFDIRQAVIRSVTYILALMTLAAVYLLVAYVIFSQLLGQTTTVGQTLMNVGLALVLAFLFQPIKRFFDRLTNQLFYKDTYSADDFYAKLNKQLTSTTDLRTLMKRTATLIAQTLKAERAFFFIYSSDNRAITAGTPTYEKFPIKDAREFEAVGKMMTAFSPKQTPHMKRLLQSHRLAIVMPLKHDGHIIGYLCLGEHLIAKYTHRDLKVLRTIADELVIAVQNALSVEQIKELNASLEQRIDAATKELRASNAQLQRLDEAKDEFISMASHQLRTPLTGIKGYVSMLLEGDVGTITDEQRRMLEEAFNSSERMVRLISDFLNVSRLQTGKFVIEKRPTDLAGLVSREIKSLEQNAKARAITLSYRAPKNIPELQLDESKFQQVVMNFTDNALYYSKEDSTVKVALKLVGDSVEFTVKDTGIGVPPAEQDQLFNKFFRATNARKQRPDGTGVGLFLAKKVIDAHEGQIIFESKEGKGSTFGFRLPVKS